MATTPPGIIERDAAYTVDEAQRRLGLGKQSRQSVDWPVRRIGGRRFVLGRDIVKWLAEQPIDVAGRPCAPSRARTPKERGLSANEALLSVFESNPDALGLSLRKLEPLTGYGKSALQATPTWDQTQMARLQIASDHAAGTRQGRVIKSDRWREPVDPYADDPLHDETDD